MKIALRTHVTFDLPLTVEQTTALITLSEHHYDGRCRMAKSDFLANWRRQIEIAIEESITDYTVFASHDQLDTCLKLLELRFSLQHLVDRAVTDALNRHFLGALHLANSKYQDWQASYEGDDG